MKISQFNNGDKVQYSSAAGIISGVIDHIRIGKNAAGKNIGWLVILTSKGYKISLPGTGLAMFNIQKLDA